MEEVGGIGGRPPTELLKAVAGADREVPHLHNHHRMSHREDKHSQPQVVQVRLVLVRVDAGGERTRAEGE